MAQTAINRDRPLLCRGRPGRRAALRAAIGRRDDGHGARHRPRRSQRGVSAHPRHHARRTGDTDGIDGTKDNAGALIGPDFLAAAGLSPRAYLADNDGSTLFSRLGKLVVAGPTLTNVNDFQAVLVI